MNHENKHIWGHAAVCVIGLLMISLISPPAAAQENNSPYDWTYVRLDYVRRDKVRLLRNFCERIHGLALQASQDKFVIACYDINKQYAEALKKGPAPDALAEQVAQLRELFSNYYIENYLAFYDILFVNLEGEVFYSIRKESDLNNNLIEGHGADIEIAKRLQQTPRTEVFIDFHVYSPSAESAAFFIEPIHLNGVHQGWILLQCAINKANALFAWTEELGQTGETFLVNEEGFMLTESNFEGASSILRKHLDDRNIQAKFTEGKGRRVVTDYRDCIALSSFEVVEFLGVRWLVVAKVDKDEITTNHYSQHHRYYNDKLRQYLDNMPLAPMEPVQISTEQRVRRVDMDEFLWAEEQDVLQTFGISTCTGLLASRPGKFAYLAHLSPRDRVYGLHVTEGETNLLGQMIKRIRTFDIYPSEQRYIRFNIVITHLNSLFQIIDKLVEEGFMLSQIQVYYNPSAGSATMYYNYHNNRLDVIWRLGAEADGQRGHHNDNAVNLGRILETIMETDLPIARGGKQINDKVS